MSLVQKSQTPAEVLPVSVCPPADKKAKMEQVPGDFSVKSGLDTKVDTKPKTDVVGVKVDKILCTRHLILFL